MKRLVNTPKGQKVETFDAAERDSWADSEAEITERLRRLKAEEIKQHGLSLIQSQIPAIDSFAMVAFLKTLWPTLTLPGSQTDLAYARDVYLYAVGNLDELETATRDQIEGYDPATDPNWP